MSIKVGIVACGYMGATTAKLCHGFTDVTVVSVQDKDASRAKNLATGLGCAWDESIDSLVSRPEIDAIIVTSPNNQHLEPVVSALNHGKHVFVEKPMALNTADCDKMIEAARRAKKILMVGHPMRFFEGLRRAKACLDAGEIGNPVAIDVYRTGWIGREGSSWKTRTSTSGGHLFHHMHEIDLACWFFGEVKSLYCLSDNLAHRFDPEEQDDVVYTLLRFKNGALGFVKQGSAQRIREHKALVYGTTGAILVDFEHAEVLMKVEGREDQRWPLHADEATNKSQIQVSPNPRHGKPGVDAPLYISNPLRDELTFFFKYIKGESTATQVDDLLDGSGGKRSVEIAEAAMRSAKEHREIDLS